MRGYVYILQNESFSASNLKIGRTTNHPGSRAHDLSRATGVPTPFTVAWYSETDDCHLAERLIHKRLAAYRTNPRREFFDLDLSKAIDVAKDVVERTGRPLPMRAGFVGRTVIGCLRIAALSIALIAGFAVISTSFREQSNPKEAAPVQASKQGALKTPPEPSPPKKIPEVEPLALRTSLPNLPTGVRTWESTDGRTTLGSVTRINVDLETVTLRLADGQEFPDYPIKNFSEEGQLFLLGRKAAKTE